MSTSTADPGSLSTDFVEALYADFLRDPESLSPQWRRYFQAQRCEGGEGRGFAANGVFERHSIFNPPAAALTTTTVRADSGLQYCVDMLIRNYRVRGHMIARLDPLGATRPAPPELDPAYYGLSDEMMDLPFTTDEIGGISRWTLREIIERLRNTYCRYIGVQFMHIDDLEIRQWLQQRMESTENRAQITRQNQLHILRRLTDAVIFEEFIQKKYVGAKRFSLEGAETLIPLLAVAIEKAARQGIDEIVIGMAHRGRLNVLANIVGKSPHQIFREFEDVDPKRHKGRGDVKYHLGHSGDWRTVDGGKVHLSLCFNPSHLEFVNPVAQGRVRAKQDRDRDGQRTRKMGLLIHGDASFIGEGVVQESLNLSQVDGYKTGGTLHVIVNNQIGFTTSPAEGRSTLYASDVAKMLQVPIFHVNGEDPEAVEQVVLLGLEFRERYQRDVIIDMYCYRKYGHNETDEPAYTHPQLYDAIRSHTSVYDGYLERMLKLGGIEREEAERLAQERREHLEKNLEVARREHYDWPAEAMRAHWEGYRGGPEYTIEKSTSAFAEAGLSDLLRKLTEFPEDFEVHPKLKRGLEARRHMADGEKPLDWAAAEALAFATLAVEGKPVRLSGQDSIRGTFSHRHAAYYDRRGKGSHMPLNHLSPDQALVEIVNSPLSETGVLGFEYGYSLDRPEGLVLWEAQFGDFCNAAQVIIDQFISSAEDKWRRLSGLVLLLPHGFEGQGPEHSSARLERFLMLAAEDNIQVVYPTTPAQIFHVLRRQVNRTWRKPLVIMTPKSLLRHPQAVSTLHELGGGKFQRLLLDAEVEPDNVKRVVLCSGKVFYDLAAYREEHERRDVAVIRIEQLYPFPQSQIYEALNAFRKDVEVFWVQEEPENMGAWRFVLSRLGHSIFGGLPLTGIMRPASASPSTGFKSSHELEQRQLVAEAFAASLSDEYHVKPGENHDPAKESGPDHG